MTSCVKNARLDDDNTVVATPCIKHAHWDDGEICVAAPWPNKLVTSMYS